MLKQWVLIALLTTGEPVHDIVDGETCHAIYDAIAEDKLVTKTMDDGREIPLKLAACIPLDVFNSVSTEKPE